MKKIKRRASCALLLAAALVALLALYIVRQANFGRDWAMFPANSAVFSYGVLDTGTLVDRNGVLLAHAGDGVFGYAESEATRRACLHAVGDYYGNIGGGALGVYADRLAGYSFVRGTRADGSETVSLSIDSSLCITAYNALGGYRGAVLVSDYATGEILCMVSSPGFDPNESSGGAEGSLINRCTGASYVPGSVFKIVTLTAAVESIPDLYTRRFHCDGSVTIGDEVVRCSGTHYEQTIEECFKNSCNVAFAELSLELGGERLAKYAERLGVAGELSLDGTALASGSFDAAEAGSAQLAWSGIGQSTNLASPYAFLRLSAAVANGGIAREPTLLYGNQNADTRLMDESTAGAVSSMMAYNVTAGYGEYLFPGLSLCAKTGTAELGDGTSHSWFTGFIRNEGHPLAFAVIVEQGGSGLGAASSIANTVLQEAVREP